MIKLFDSGPKDLLPSNLVDADEIAISYAIQMAMQKLQTFMKRTRLYGDIDSVPEEILDLMALELRTQYYDETLEIEKKRELIRNTLAWYEKAGTTAAVEQMVATVFSGANVIEWQDMPEDEEPEPGTFAVEVIDNDSAGDRYKELRQIIKNVKMASAHLAYIRRIIEIYLNMEATNRVYLSKITIGMKFPYWKVHRLDGSWALDGSVRLNGLTINMPVNMRILFSIKDMWKYNLSQGIAYLIKADLSGELDLMSKPKIRYGMTFPYWRVYRFDGSWPLSGAVRLNGLTISMPVSVRLGLGKINIDESGVDAGLSLAINTHIDTIGSSLKKVAFLVSAKLDSGETESRRVRISMALSVDGTNRVTAEVTLKKNVWYLDGNTALDGTQTLNASIIKEEI